MPAYLILQRSTCRAHNCLVALIYTVHSYDKGGHLFLPSYVMRTHGARQQREAIRRTPKEQLQPVFEVCERAICQQMFWPLFLERMRW